MTTERKYNKAREEFVKRMMGLQHEFASWEGSPAKPRSRGKSKIMLQTRALVSDEG
jgi:hypothetical protein